MALPVLLTAILGAASAWTFLGMGSGGEGAPAALRLRIIRHLEHLGETGISRILGRLGLWRRGCELVDRVLPMGGTALVRGLMVLALAASTVLAILVMGVAGMVFGPALALGGLWLWVRSDERVRMSARSHEVPDLLRSLASGLGAGQTLSQAITYVGNRGDGDVARAFRRAALEVLSGVSAEVALDDAMADIHEPGMDLALAALMVSQRTGAPLDDLLGRSAALVEEQHGLALLLRTKTAQVRLSAVVVMGLPVVIVALLTLVSPDFRAGLSTAVGIGCVAVAALLDGMAILIMGRIMARVGL